MSNFPEDTHPFQGDEKGGAGRIPHLGKESAEARQPFQPYGPFPQERNAVFTDRNFADQTHHQPADPVAPANNPSSENDILALLTDSTVPVPLRNAALNQATLLAPSQLQALFTALKNTLDDPRYSVRATVLKALGALNRREHLRQFIYALQDPAWQVRTTAVRELGKLGQEAPLNLLVEALDDPDITVKDAAIWALRPLAVWAWEKFEDEKPLLALRAALTDESEVVRAAAVEAAGSFANYVPFNELLIRSRDDTSELVRAAAALTLGNLREDQAQATLLLALANDKSEMVRASAAEALGLYGPEQPADALLRAFNRETSADVRCAILKSVCTLGEMMPVEVLDMLHRALKDRSAEVRAQARIALDELYTQIYEHPSLPFLFSLLQNESADMRQLALRALEARQNRQATARATKVRQDAHETRRAMVIWALEQIVQQISGADEVPATPAAPAQVSRQARGLFLALINFMKERKGFVQAETRGEGTLVLRCFYQQERPSLQEAVLSQVREVIPVSPLAHALDEEDETVQSLARQALYKREEHWTETCLVALNLASLQAWQATEDLPARILVCCMATNRGRAGVVSLGHSLEQYIKEHCQRQISERACAWLEKCRVPIFQYARGISAMKLWYTTDPAPL